MSGAAKPNTIARPLTEDEAKGFASMPVESFALVRSTLSDEAIAAVESARNILESAKVWTVLDKHGSLVPEDARDDSFREAAKRFAELLPEFSSVVQTLFKPETRGVQGRGDTKVIVRDSKAFPTLNGAMQIKLTRRVES